MSSNTFLDSLNPNQQAAVIHGEGPAIVLAGAGSGKTRVLTTRASWLIENQGVLPEEILLVTFTNKAAQEINNRMLQQNGHVLPFAGTFHRICAKILRREGYLVGLSPNFIIYDSDDQLDLIKQLYKEHHWSEKEFNPKGVKAVISSAKNEMLSSSQYEQQAHGSYQQFVARVYHAYQSALSANNAVDFDDLMLKVIDVFIRHPEILEKYQNSFKHVLIDEYQDTNKVQYTLSKLLALPQTNLYVVGDFSQSIYAWRGADYRNMLHLRTDFPEIQEYRLEQNYRSTQTILNAATAVISQNTLHPILELWTENTERETITIYEASSGEDEANTVVRYITTHELSTPYSEKVILYRTNAQSRLFEEALLKAGVPYKIVGGLKFYARKEIKDLLAHLRLCINPKEAVSLERVTKLGKRKLETFFNWREQTLLQLVQSDITEFGDLQPLALLEKILQTTQYRERYDERDPEDLARIENIQELLTVASQFETVNQFLENVSLIQDDQMADLAKSEQQETVTLMSLHSAKGLEYGVVFMVGMEEGLFPHSRALFEKEQMEEERRLCYVGITRAKSKLYMTYARHRLVYGSVTSNLPSRFLFDIPEELVEKEIAQEPMYGRSNGNRGGYNSYQPWQKRPAAAAPNPKRHVVPLDDSSLDDFLSGDIDIDTFLRKE